MKNRYDKIVLEAKKGITFNVSEGTNGELIIRAVERVKNEIENLSRDKIDWSLLPSVSAGQYADELSVYTDKFGSKVPILPGWTVSKSKNENTVFGQGKSLVIYRIPKEDIAEINWGNPFEHQGIMKSYDQLVWCPTEFLPSNGTIDGVNFSEKFGRRKYRDDQFSDEQYHEELTSELLEQVASVIKYGGFYFTRYNISRSTEGNPQSIANEYPWTKVKFDLAKGLASSLIEENEIVKSHLVFGAEYDSILEWLIASKSKTIEEIENNSTEWGNYWNRDNALRILLKIGCVDAWEANNIYDLAGNVDEWTQESLGNSRRTKRGGSCRDGGVNCPVSARTNRSASNESEYTSFRAAIYIK